MTGSPGTRAASMPAAIAGLLLTTATAMAAAPKADQVLCWMDRSTDSKLKHLYCSSREAAAGSHCNARNALLHMAEMLDIDAGDPWLGRTPSRSGKQVYVSSFTIAEGQVNRLIQQLGPGSVDWAIIRATENLRKAPLPEDAPSDEEMAQFVDAYRAVEKISDYYDPQIAQASGNKRDFLLRKSDEKMAEAIKNAGLTVDEYNHIAELSEESLALKARLHEKLVSQ